MQSGLPVEKEWFNKLIVASLPSLVSLPFCAFLVLVLLSHLGNLCLCIIIVDILVLLLSYSLMFLTSST